jgi:hypothetical protein
MISLSPSTRLHRWSVIKPVGQGTIVGGRASEPERHVCAALAQCANPRQACAASFSFFIGRTLTFTVAGFALKTVS